MSIELDRVGGAEGISRTTAQRVRVRAHEFLADMKSGEGGNDEGPTPHDLYDAALGACKALTVLWYAQRKGLPVEDVHTVVERDDSNERKGVYRLMARVEVSGNLTDAQLTELEAVAHRCPVHKLMTQATTEITTELRRAP